MSNNSQKKIWPLTYDNIMNDLKSLPESLKNCAEQYFSPTGRRNFGNIKKKLDSMTFSRVIFIGNTYNYFASLISLNIFLQTPEKLNFFWDSFEISEFYDYILPENIDDSTLYIFISKSINKLTVKSIEHLESINTDPNKIWLITNNPDSDLAKKCGIVFPIYAGTEIVLGTKTYQNAITVLFLISQLLSKKDPLEYENYLGIESLIHFMRDFWKRKDDIIPEIIQFLGPNPDFLQIISRGASLSSAYEAASNVKSFARILSEGVDIGLFFYGPFQMADQNFRAILIIGDELDEGSFELVMRLTNEITTRKGKILILTRDENLSKTVKDSDFIYKLDFQCRIPSLSPIKEMFILHHVFLEMSKRNGIVL